MNKPDSLVKFAVLSDDHDFVLGFAVSRENVLDYVHVHTSFRRHGIATELVPKDIVAYSHVTSIGLQINMKPKYKDIKFNPFA